MHGLIQQIHKKSSSTFQRNSRKIAGKVTPRFKQGMFLFIQYQSVKESSNKLQPLAQPLDDELAEEGAKVKEGMKKEAILKDKKYINCFL